MRTRLGLSHYLLLPALLALGGTLTIMVWSLYLLKDQSQTRTLEMRHELTILNEVASIDRTLIENHQMATEALHKAASGQLDEAALHRIRSSVADTLAEIEERLHKILLYPEVQSDKDIHVQDMRDHMHQYRNYMVMASDSAVRNPVGAARHLTLAQEHMIEFSRHRQNLSLMLAERARGDLEYSISDYDMLFARTLAGSLLGTILMAALIFISSRSVRSRLTTLSTALATLHREERVPLVMADVERMSHDKIDEMREMANAVLAFRQSIIDRQMALVELTHYKEHLEELAEERTSSLKASEARLSEAQAIAHMGNWDWDLRAGDIHWSAEIYRIFGWQASDAPMDAQHFAAVVHPEDLPLLRDEVDRAINEPDYQYQVDHRIVREDGTIRHVQNIGKLIRKDGVPQRLIGVIHDITDRVVAREEMELYRLMIEKSADPVFLIDIEDQFRMVYVNEAAIAHYGAPREEILTWRVPDWDPNFTYADLPAHLERMKAHEGEGMLIETLHRSKGGEVVPVEVTLNLTRYKGRLFHFGYIKNISARKQTEQQLQAAKAEAEAATRSKSEFLANMSHEIRTPMNAVINLSRLVLQSDLNERQRDYVQKVVRAGENLLAIINDILDFSKIEAGKMSIDAVPFDLEEVIGHISDLLAYRAKGDAVEYLIDMPVELPGKLIGDPLRLGQVLTNLVGNALKFTTQGTVVLAVDLVAQQDEQLILNFSVCDTGIGISREQQQHLFQPFAQADGTTTRRFGGTGLGLTISRHLLKLMNSSLYLESSPGKGSTFSFTLALPLGEVRRQLPLVQSDAAGSRIMLVDDNPAARHILHDMLQEFGGTIAVYDNGADALLELRRACGNGMPYDLLLLDWVMPELDGIETMSRVVHDSAIEPKPQGVLVTAYGSDVVRSQALAAGFSEVLDKPITPSRLCRLVSERCCSDVDACTQASSLQSYAEMSRLQGARVLLVEDNEINQEIAAELLSNLNIEVKIAENGIEALAALEQGNYDLVLMDLQMPLLDGYETTRQIRRQERWRDLPIIAMTAHALEGERARCLAAGMNDHLAKPIDVALLHIALQHWLAPHATVSAPLSQVVTQHATLPVYLPGIELRRGLERVGQNRELYLSLLLRFRATQQQMAVALLTALSDGAREQAQQIAHSLRGVAGNLGAERLAEAAAGLERDLHGATDEQIDDRVSILLVAMDEVMLGLAALSATTNEAAPPREGAAPPAEGISILLKKLAEALESDLHTARQNYQDLKPLLAASPLALEGERLGAALADYDTDEALRQLRLIAAAFEAEL